MCSHKLMHYQGNVITSVDALASAYYQSSPITSLGVFNKNDYMCQVLRLGTISLITKCRKRFRRKVVFSKSNKIKALLQVVLYLVIRPMVSDRKTHHILNY